MNAFCDLAERYPWEEARPGLLGTDILVRTRARRRRRGDRAVEHAAVRHVAKLVPALLAGLHHRAQARARDAARRLLLAEMLDEAGLPPGVVSVLPAGREVGEHLVRHPGVDKVAFTGSTAAGRAVAAAAATSSSASASSSAASRPRSSSTTPTSAAVAGGRRDRPA